MPDYLLYHMPGSCSRVAMVALEEIGLPYSDRGVALMRGEQRSPEFVAINPKSKVPVLIAEAKVITELPVILAYLSQQHPDARLLPSDDIGARDALSDLVWIAGALHPLMNRMFRPAAVAPSDPVGAKATANELLAEHAKRIVARLEAGGWWTGTEWSITDTFLGWVYQTAASVGFALDEFPLLAEHAARVSARPAFVRARDRELKAMERDGLELPPGASL